VRFSTDPLSVAACDALFGKSGRLRGVLDAVSAYERGQWDALLDVAF
jgi:hypothetical protein